MYYAKCKLIEKQEEEFRTVKGETALDALFYADCLSRREKLNLRVVELIEFP